GPLMAKTGPDGVTRRCPAPDAVVRLAELGLVPLRPAASRYLPDLTALPYLPPERVENNSYDSRCDVYELGATLYFLLTGRPRFAGNDTVELLGRVREAEPAALTMLRPDLPKDFVALIARMMEKQPDRRPPTTYDVELELANFCRPEKVLAQVEP